MENNKSQIEYTQSEKEALNYIEKVQHLLNQMKDGINRNVGKVYTYDKEDVIRELTRTNEYTLEYNMKNRVIEKLYDKLDYIKKLIDNNNTYVCLYDIPIYVLEGAYTDGTLTFSTYRAQLELLSTYSLDEIVDHINEMGIQNTNTETIHICKSEEILRGLLEDACEDEDDKDKIMLACYQVLLDNDYTLDEEHQKNYDRLTNDGRELEDFIENNEIGDR